MSNIHDIICAMAPDKYFNASTPGELRAYKNLIKKQGLDAAIKKANPKAASQYQINYDSATEQLEPMYFWILDFMTHDIFKPNDVEKIVDNFASSPGGGHFSELQGKSSQMQQEASRVLGTVNNILKGVINLIYDLKEFKIRLSHYEAAESKDPIKREAGLLALKQMWMDKVDIQRGVGSINAMTSGDLNFVTLRDEFLSAKSVEQADRELDLNERVKRILKPRLQEFFEWQKRSKQELEKRYEIEKAYLKSQVAALKLNTRWAKPYLKAAQQLSSNADLSNNAALVSVFNTLLLNLTIMGKGKIDVKDAAQMGELPKDFKKIKNLRTYYRVVVIDFSFRGIPQRQGQHWTFGGRAEVTFRCYALNQDEIDLLHVKLDESDVNDAFDLIEGMTEDSLGQLKLDLKDLLGDDDPEKKKEADINPFSALFNVFSTEEKKSKDKEEKEKKMNEMKEKGPKHENYAEGYIRNWAEVQAIGSCFTVYDIYKKAHGMAAFPYSNNPETAKPPQSTADHLFGFK